MLISVIIPIYNCEKYLAYCLDKLINQSFYDIEIICIDDGSCDNTLKILDEFKIKDSRIKIIKQEHKGTAAARNIGLNNAIGDYISFIDADDIVSIDLYKKAYDVLSTNNPDILIYNGIFYDNKKKKVSNKKFFDVSSIKNYKNEYTIHTYKDFDNIFFLQNSVAIKIYKYSFLKEKSFKFKVDSNFEDTLFNIYTLLNAKTISVMDEYLYLYRKNLDSSTNSRIYAKNSKLLLEIFSIFDDIESLIEEKFQELLKDFYSYLINLLCYYFYNAPLKLKKIFYKKLKEKIITNTIYENIKNNSKDLSIYNKIKNSNYIFFYLYLLRNNYFAFALTNDI